MLTRALAAALAAAALLPAGAAAQRRSSVPPPTAVPDEFVVQFAPGADREAALRDHGGRAIDRVPALDAVVVRMPAARAERAKADKRFALVEPNGVYHSTWTPNDPSLGQQWAWDRIDAPEAWDTARGASTAVVAIIDTGVQRSHPDLDAKIVPGYDYVQNDTSPDDGNGHGTHVAGSAAAETNNGTGGAGTCPGCAVMPVRVLDNKGSGTLANVAKGITFAADNGADVINLSLGGGGSSTLQQAVDYAASKGVFQACAAGNDGTSATTGAYPAAYAGCFAVASTTSTDARSSFSNYGTWVEVAAPGSSIYSTWTGSSYRTISGTSMATPHVAGLAGLLVAQGLTGAQVRDRVCSTADAISGTGSLWTCGRINAQKAVTGGAAPPPPPGTDLIENGGFESGTPPWTQTSSGGFQLIDTARPRSGSYSAWLGGYHSGTDTIGQSVTVPPDGRLRYWWYMTTEESGSTVYDRLQVRLLSSSGTVLTTLRTFSNASGGGVWREDVLSLGGYAGQSVTPEFRVTTDSSLLTSFFVDDVSVG